MAIPLSPRRARASSLTRVAQLGGQLDVGGLDAVDPRERHVVDPDARVEGDRGQDRELGRGVGAADVLGRVGLGVAQLLGLRQRVRVRLSVTGHGREHEVGRPVDDPEHLAHVAATSDSRSTLTTGIAAQTEASKRSWAPPRSAAANSSSPCRASSCLFAETTETPRSSSSSRYARVGSTPPISSATTRTRGSSRTVGEVGGEQAVAGVARLRRVADEGAHHPDRPAGDPLHVVGVLDEQPVDRGAHRAEAEQTDSEGLARGHGARCYLLRYPLKQRVRTRPE